MNVNDLIDELYEMVEKAWSLPMSPALPDQSCRDKSQFSLCCILPPVDRKNDFAVPV